MVFACGMLMACHSDIDLKNVDTTAQLQMGMALPVGSVRAQLGDFVGQIQGLYIDSVNGGVITWRDTFRVSRNFHQVDLAQYISEKKLNLNVYDKLPAAAMIGTNKKVIGDGHPRTLDFDMPLKLKGINDPDSLDKERLDSARISMASFRSIIKQHNLPLEWEWIDKVTLDLGNQLRRPAGNTMTIYDKTRDNYGYNQTISTDVDHFTITLMKKNSAGQYVIGQVIDSCNFTIHFTFTIPAGTEVLVPEDAGFEYNLGVQFIDYDAIWGKFVHSKDMYDEAVVDLSESWGSLSFLSDGSLPFTDPKIDMYIVTQVAGAMKVDGDYLFSEDAAGEKHYASFKYGSTTTRDFHRQFESWEYLDPITSTIGDSTTNMMIPFDKDPERGHIDLLFVNMPQKLGYKFNVDFNYNMTPQIRITPNTSVRINAACNLPLKFRDGLFVNYTDTIKDVNLTAVNIDSLVRESQIIDSLHAGEVTLYITALSEIPLTVKAVFEYLGKDGQPIKDPTDPTKLFNPFLEDTLRVVPPVFTKNAMGQWVPGEPGKSILTAHMSKEQLKVVPDIKRIAYKVLVDNEALNYAFKANPSLKEAPLTSEQHLELNIGLTAQIDAIMNFNSKK